MPNWTIVSAYTGKKKQHQGLTFNTGFDYFLERFAQMHADKLNEARQDRWPGHEFEFRVVPYEATADTPEE